MAVLPIVLWPDPMLSQPCQPVGRVTPAIRALAEDMLETMYAAPGRGLAAPQVGRTLRLFVMDAGWKDGARDPRICIDPEILWASETRETGPEGCLSIPGVTAEVTRPAEIRLRWTDAAGRRQEAHLTGFDAVCAQHEIDHLDGRVTFDRLDPTARARLEASYRESGAA